MAPIEIEVVSPSALTAEDLASWRRLQAASPDHRSPFLSPDWICAVARLHGPDRQGARIAVLRRNGEAVGFLPVRVGRGRAIPAGAPFCDYGGPVAGPDVEIPTERLLKALKVGRYDLQNASGCEAFTGPHARARSVSWIVDLSDGYAAYATARRRAGSDVLQDCAKKQRKLAREVGPTTFTGMSMSAGAFAQLFAWKRAQLKATRQTDLFATPWTMQLMEAMFHAREPGFGGALFTLHVGERLAAAHFALRGDRVLHAWMIAHDPELGRYSPGVILIREALEWAAGQGYAEFDLGPGDYRFKTSLASRTRSLSHGFVGRPSASSLLRSAQYALRDAAEALPLGSLSELPAKAMRRMDLVSALR